MTWGEAGNFLSIVLGGGFAGATIVAAIFNFIIKNQLEKSLINHRDQLDLKKIELQSELSIFVESRKVENVSYRQKHVAALEGAYSAIVSTSIPRHKFIKAPKIQSFSGEPDEQETSKYFHLFSENFKSFSLAFDAIFSAFAKIEECAIYLEDDFEFRINSALSDINKFYYAHHAILVAAHDQGQRNFDGVSIPSSLRSFDFIKFHEEMHVAWRGLAMLILSDLKKEIRKILRPSKAT